MEGKKVSARLGDRWPYVVQLDRKGNYIIRNYVLVGDKYTMEAETEIGNLYEAA